MAYKQEIYLDCILVTHFDKDEWRYQLNRAPEKLIRTHAFWFVREHEWPENYYNLFKQRQYIGNYGFEPTHWDETKTSKTIYYMTDAQFIQLAMLYKGESNVP